MVFNKKSIVMFNNTVFNGETIVGMTELHATTERLYQAARELRGVSGQSAVARVLEVTPQVMKNWEKRGLSEGGALAAQKHIGCNANWLLEGGEIPRRTPWMPSQKVSVLSVSEDIPPYRQAFVWPFRQVGYERLANLVRALGRPQSDQAIEQLDDNLDALVSKWELKAEAKKNQAG